MACKIGESMWAPWTPATGCPVLNVKHVVESVLGKLNSVVVRLSSLKSVKSVGV